MKSEIYLHLLDARPLSLEDLERLNSDIKFLERQFSSMEGLRKIRAIGNPSSAEYLIEDRFDGKPTVHSKYTQEEIRGLKVIKNF